MNESIRTVPESVVIVELNRQKEEDGWIMSISCHRRDGSEKVKMIEKMNFY
jgi:hypothetical protein